jgi:hypothetical protein
MHLCRFLDSVIRFHGSSSSTKESAIRGLRNLAHNNDEMQLQIERAGIFEPLVCSWIAFCIRVTLEEELFRWFLSPEVLVQVELLQSGSDTCQEAAAIFVWKLASHPESKVH